MIIKQGDIFWLKLTVPKGSEPGFRRPHASRIKTVVVCGLTSNLRQAHAPGNVTHHKGEANIEKKSVVNISQVVTVNKSDLSEKIGSLSPARPPILIPNFNSTVTRIDHFVCYRDG